MPLVTDRACLELDADHDLVIPLRFATGIHAVAQGIRVRLMLIRGEWFLDQSVGTPWLENDSVTAAQALLGQAFDREKLLAACREAILGTPGVNRILSLECEFDGAARRARVRWVVNTTFGDTEPDELEREF
jgi:hypothetical protein